MVEINITDNQVGQRLDKLLKKVLDKAPNSFIYKMLRKKNIKLNDKKAEGREMLEKNDNIKIYLADETFDKFSSMRSREKNIQNDTKLQKECIKIDIVYEDEHILVLDKPAGMLSQASKKGEYSLNGFVVDYIGRTEVGFTPSICNRLDRNTSGLVVAGKSLLGLQTMSELIKERRLEKDYIAVVEGKIHEPGEVEKWMIKDRENNKVVLYDSEVKGSKYSRTGYEPLKVSDRYTMLKIHLYTGRTHQIRSHMASIGHPVVGDVKYGNGGARRQLLHSYSLKFPEMDGEFAALSEKVFYAEIPQDMKIMG
ncbi:MAG: RluA family pseudouridine synthase [Eubacterium sp.]|nr:RluA family pseudouridine synthase [Eubacterium sp.]